MSNETFTIAGITGTFTASDYAPRGYEHSHMTTGRVEWEDSITINGVDYRGGVARIKYRRDWGFTVEATVWAGITGRELTASARKKLEQGIRDAPGAAHLFVLPTLEQVNAAILEGMRRAGKHSVSRRDADREQGDWQNVIEAVTGERARNPYSLQSAPGVVTENDAWAAYLEGVIEVAQRELDAVRSWQN